MSWRNFFTGPVPRVDAEALEKKAEESLNSTAAKQERVNYLTNWLESRNNKNGFGEDFEYTLRPKAST